MWNATTPTKNILFAIIFWTEANEKCIQTKFSERQLAKGDLLLPIVNQIHIASFKALKKPLKGANPVAW